MKLIFILAVSLVLVGAAPQLPVLPPPVRAKRATGIRAKRATPDFYAHHLHKPDRTPSDRGNRTYSFSVREQLSMLADQVKATSTLLRTALNGLPVESTTLFETQRTQLRNAVAALLPILVSRQAKLEEAQNSGNAQQTLADVPVVGKIFNAVTEIPLVGDLAKGLLSLNQID